MTVRFNVGLQDKKGSQGEVFKYKTRLVAKKGLVKYKEQTYQEYLGVDLIVNHPVTSMGYFAGIMDFVVEQWEFMRNQQTHNGCLILDENCFVPKSDNPLGDYNALRINSQLDTKVISNLGQFRRPVPSEPVINVPGRSNKTASIDRLRVYSLFYLQDRNTAIIRILAGPRRRENFEAWRLRRDDSGWLPTAIVSVQRMRRDSSINIET
ncbi:hypothetical protein MIR68_005590 [Amoeboaphelidium protococcarum]|nr:hypothetical protein MIR68_005590 [Amoeboaphelidium protococcarum]